MIYGFYLHLGLTKTLWSIYFPQFEEKVDFEMIPHERNFDVPSGWCTGYWLFDISSSSDESNQSPPSALQLLLISSTTSNLSSSFTSNPGNHQCADCSLNYKLCHFFL